MSSCSAIQCSRFLGAFMGLACAVGLSGAQVRAQALEQSNASEPVTEFRFRDATGNVLTIADFRGRVVLLNMWATWCGPCRYEMPVLDRVQERLGSNTFKVIALAIDETALEVRSFYEEHGLKNLTVYLDDGSEALQALRAVGLPTTVLIDKEGHEVGRLLGPALWDAPEMVDLIRRYQGAAVN